MSAQLSTQLTLDGSQHNDALRNATKEVSKYKREVDSANKQMNNMKKELNGVTSGLNSMFNSIKTGNFSGMYEGAASATGALKNLIPMMGATATGATAMGAAISAALGPIGLAVAAIGAIGAVTVKAASSYEKYNTALLDLSALTGVTGKELDAVGDIAMNMSVKFGTSAEDIINSMKNIGSQAPQLLSDMNSLSAVTESAMVLSKASGMVVEDTSKAITTIMNQMGVDASQTSEIINSMAAGSKYGAADVQYLTTAFEKCGTQAKGAGMSFQQVIAAVETIAPKFKSADDAGQKLNGVLRNLQTQANDNFNPAIVGINKALENLSNANLSLAEKQKLVGAEGLTVLDVMTSNKQAFEDMTKNVTGTNVAYDQMNIKSNTLKATFDKLTQTINVLFIELGKTFIVQALISILNSLCKMVIKVFGFINDLIKVVNALWNKFKETTGVQNFIRMFNKIKDAVLNVIRVISNQWNRFLKWLGINSSGEFKITNTTKTNNTPSPNVSTGGSSGGSVRLGSGSRYKSTNKQELKIIEDPIVTNLNNSIKTLTNTLQQSVKNAEGTSNPFKDRMGIAYNRYGSIESEYNSTYKVVESAKNLISKLDEKFDSNAYNKKDKNGKEYFDFVELNTDTSLYLETQKILKENLAKLDEIAKRGKDELTNASNKKHTKTNDTTKKLSKFDLFSKNSGDITGAFYGIDGIVGSVESLTNAIEEGANAWEVFMGILQTFNSVLGAVGDTMKAITTIQEILGITTQETAAIQSAATAEDTANTAIEVANSTTKTAAKSGEAIAGATSSGASMPFPYNLIAIAAGVAAVIGALSLIGSFADGGIIQGRSTIGDYNLARVNGGEMILNTRQQNNLFKAINENRLGYNSGVVGGTIKIKGSDLYVALKNYGNAKSKVGKNIGIR